ncbi:transmembrane protein 256 isoform X1 [Tamandua tetradactyla]|uniref:transmembrane protein 256 isoform X1 n=1 Tax=Tamandua tetradactyla TaxID=48850 RepID=UPI004053D74F
MGKQKRQVVSDLEFKPSRPPSSTHRPPGTSPSQIPALPLPRNRDPGGKVSKKGAYGDCPGQSQKGSQSLDQVIRPQRGTWGDHLLNPPIAPTQPWTQTPLPCKTSSPFSSRFTKARPVPGYLRKRAL